MNMFDDFQSPRIKTNIAVATNTIDQDQGLSQTTPQIADKRFEIHS